MCCADSFDRTFAEHAQACEDAWRQLLQLVGERSGVGQPAAGPD